jgi:hypothetical protein
VEKIKVGRENNSKQWGSWEADWCYKKEVSARGGLFSKLKENKKETTKSIFSKQVEHVLCCFFILKIYFWQSNVKTYL